jgi:prevent-host-death family protein
MRQWQLQEAKNRLSELIQACLQNGPQIVTKRGKETAVLLSIEEYQRLIKPKESLADFLQKSPLKGVNLDLKRNKDLPREVGP